MQSISVFFNITKFVNFWWKKKKIKKMLMLAESKVFVMWFICFLDLLEETYNWQVSSLWDMLDRFWREGFFWSTHPWVAPKRSVLNRVKMDIKTNLCVTKFIWQWFSCHNKSKVIFTLNKAAYFVKCILDFSKVRVPLWLH